MKQIPKSYTKFISLPDSDYPSALANENSEAIFCILLGLDSSRKKFCIFTTDNGYYELPTKILKSTDKCDVDWQNIRIINCGRNIAFGDYIINVKELLEKHLT